MFPKAVEGYRCGEGLQMERVTVIRHKGGLDVVKAAIEVVEEL